MHATLFISRPVSQNKRGKPSQRQQNERDNTKVVGMQNISDDIRKRQWHSRFDP